MWDDVTQRVTWALQIAEDNRQHFFVPLEVREFWEELERIRGCLSQGMQQLGRPRWGTGVSYTRHLSQIGFNSPGGGEIAYEDLVSYDCEDLLWMEPITE